MAIRDKCETGREGLALECNMSPCSDGTGRRMCEDWGRARKSPELERGKPRRSDSPSGSTKKGAFISAWKVLERKGPSARVEQLEVCSSWGS